MKNFFKVLVYVKFILNRNFKDSVKVNFLKIVIKKLQTITETWENIR